MKNLSVIINVVLGIVVVGLLVLHFKDAPKTNTAKPAISSSTTALTTPGNTIAYVDLDTLQQNYIYFKDKKSEFERSQKSLESTLQVSMETFQREATEFEQKAQTMSQSEGEATQQRLIQKKAQLEQMRDNGAQNLQNQMTKFNLEVYNKIDSVLQDYNKDHKYAYILSYQKGGAILYRDRGLDITADVVELLNKTTDTKK